MPTREEIMAFVCRLFDQWIRTSDDIWLALYRLLLDYIHSVPRITDSNRLRVGIWRDRARQIEKGLAFAMSCKTHQVKKHLDVFMRKLYLAGTQRMNPIGIAFACSIVYLLQRFASGSYKWKMEAKIGTEVFPNLANFRRKTVDIVAFHQGNVLQLFPVNGAFAMIVCAIHKKKQIHTKRKCHH